MSQNKDSILIAGNKLFAGINEAELKINFSSKNLTAIKEGEVIFQNGGSSEDIYLLIDGEVKIKFPNPNGAPIIETKNKNDFFGEKEFIEKTPRKSSAVAETNCLLFILNRSEYNELTALNPLIKKNQPLENIDASSQKYFSDSAFRHNSRKQWVIEPEAVVKEHHDEVQLNNIDDEIVEPELEEISAPEDIKDDESLVSMEDIVDTKTEDHVERKEEKDESNLEWNFNSLPPEENNPLPARDFVQETSESPTSWDFSEYSPPSEEKEPAIFEYEQNINEIQFYEIIDAIKRINSNLQIGKVSEQTIKETIYLTGAERGRIYFKDKNENDFYGLVPGTNEKNEIRIKINEGITGTSAAENIIINIQNPTDDSRYSSEVDNPGEDNLENLLSFPISNEQGEVIAILELFNSPKIIFGKEEINLLSRLSPIIAQAIENSCATTVSTNDSQFPAVSRITNFLIGDLNSAITLIKNYSDIIKKKNIAVEINPILTMISNQADLINDSLSSMMNFITGDNNLTLRKENINSLMNDTVSMLAEYAELRKVKLYKKITGNISIMIDKKEFFQACFQITKNACDAMPEGGEIFIITKTADDSASIEFRDTGTGIPEEIQSKIFEPFFSFGKNNNTGLGLSIAEKIIRNHGGNIFVSKSEGAGAIFSITLPATV